jgi:hypothetical protein
VSNSEDRAFQDGASGGMFTGSTASEYAAFTAGRATRPRDGGAPLLPGAWLGFLLIALAPMVFTVVGALYPLAALTMLATLVVIIELTQGIGFIVVYVIAIVWLFIALGFGVILEKYLDDRRWYRSMRHVSRIVAIGFVVHVLAFGFFRDFDASTSFFQRLTVTHLVIVASACIGAHFLSKKLDAGLRDRVSEQIPGIAWALQKLKPRRKANEAALAALEQRMGSRKA